MPSIDRNAKVIGFPAFLKSLFEMNNEEEEDYHRYTIQENVFCNIGTSPDNLTNDIIIEKPNADTSKSKIPMLRFVIDVTGPFVSDMYDTINFFVYHRKDLSIRKASSGIYEDAFSLSLFIKSLLRTKSYSSLFA